MTDGGVSQPIQSVRRGMRLLACFSPQRTEWSVSDLARATGIHKSVVTRLMATMALDGFVAQDPRRRTYAVGPKAFVVGSAYRPYTLLHQIAQPVMQHVTDRCGHATSLGVPAGDKFVYVLATESTLPVRVVAEVGEERAYHMNAIGKVLLAALPDDEVRSLLGPEPLTTPTPHTIDSIDRLLAELVEVRRSGVAFNRQEAVLGVGAVGAPIRNGSAGLVAGFSVVYPSHLVSDAEVEQIIALTRSAAAEISAGLSR